MGGMPWVVVVCTGGTQCFVQSLFYAELLYYDISLTLMVKVSWQAPPATSRVFRGPWVVNVSKSSRRKHTSECEM